LLNATGCTKPTQIIAQDALQRAKQQDNKIIKDLSTLAKQYALDITGYKMHSAKDDKERDKIVLSFMNELDKISFLQITHERVLRILGITERYVWEQQGILNILSEEWSEARKIAKKKKENKLAVQKALKGLKAKNTNTKNKSKSVHIKTINDRLQAPK